MSFHNTHLIDTLSKNPNFPLLPSYFEFAEKPFNGCPCQYPILPLGIYIKPDEPEPKKWRIALDALITFGIALAMCYALPTYPLSGFTIGWLSSFSLTHTGKKTLQVASNYGLFPQFIERLLSSKDQEIQKFWFKQLQIAFSHLVEDHCKLTKIALRVNRTLYNAFFVSPTNKLSAEWVLHTTGQYPTYNFETLLATSPYSQHGLYPNHCYIYPFSGCHPTNQKLGEGFELGLQLLEEVGASKILMEAEGEIGGIILSEGVRKHTFKKDVKYMALEIDTLRCLSKIPMDHLDCKGKITKSRACVIEKKIDVESSATKLAKHEIDHIVVQKIALNSRMNKIKTFLKG